FAQQLVDIRQTAISSVAEQFERTPPSVDAQLLTTEYRKAFAQAGLDVDADPAMTSATIRASVLGEKTVSALDEWALAAFLLKRAPEQQELLQIARLADPDPAWGDRFRDPAAWGDPKKLRQLADDAFRAPKSPPAHKLAITATLLDRLGARSEGRRLLREALRRRPTDFRLNWEMGDAYWRDGRPK